MITEKEKNKVIKQFRQYLKEHNLRCTPTRMMILEYCTTAEPPILIKELLEYARRENMAVQTVYDTLDVLVDARILERITLQGKLKKAFTLVSATRNKAKIICTECGRVAEFRDWTITERLRSHKYTNFDMDYFTVVVYGKCKVCRKLVGKSILDSLTDDNG